MPALPLMGGGHGLLQPVFVGDVAEAIALAVDGKAEPGTIYELGGPEPRSFKEIMAFILETTGRRRALVPLPFPAAMAMGRATETAKRLAFGFFPPMLDMTEDQVRLLQIDNVVSPGAKAEGRTLQGLGIRPESPTRPSRSGLPLRAFARPDSTRASRQSASASLRSDHGVRLDRQRQASTRNDRLRHAHHVAPRRRAA